MEELAIPLTWMSMRAPSPVVESRRLVALYLVNGVPIAWRCSLCGKLFSISLHEAFGAAQENTADAVYCEFRTHSCVVCLRCAASDLR